MKKKPPTQHLVEVYVSIPHRGYTAAKVVMSSWWQRARRDATKWVSWIVLGVIVLGALYQALCHTEAFADDAAITFSYSRHLAESGELLHTASSERVEGFSNPTWTLLNVLPFLLHMDSFIFARAVGVLCFLMTIFLVYRSTQTLCARSATARFVATAFFAMTPSVCFWTMAGLETPLIGLLLAALLLQAIREERDPSSTHHLSGLIVAVLALSRPEGLIYAGPLVFYKALCLLRTEPARRQALLRRHAANLIAMIVPVLAYFLWRRLYFSAWLPNTYYAKLTSFQLLTPEDTDESRGVRYVRGFFRANHLWALVYGAPAALLVRLLWPEALFVLALVGAHLFFVFWVDGDWMGDFRFFAFGMPLYAVTLGMALQGAGDLLERLGTRFSRPTFGRTAGRVVSGGLALAFLATSLLPTLGEYSRAGWVSMELVRRQGTGMEMLARRAGMLRASIAVPDVGGSALATNLRIFDTVGLVDPVIARFKSRPGRVRQYFFEEARPDFYQQHSHWVRYYNFPNHFEFRRDYVELPQSLTKRMVLLGSSFIRREHLTGHLEEADRRAVHELGRGLILRGWDVPRRSQGQVVIQLWVESRGERPRPGDHLTVGLRPAPVGRQPALTIDLESVPEGLFEPGTLLRFRFWAEADGLEAFGVRGLDGATTPWIEASAEEVGHGRGVNLERYLLTPRTHFTCAPPPPRWRSSLGARGRLQIFDRCEPRYRAEEVDGLVEELRARASASLEVDAIRPALFLLDRAEMLRPEDQSLRREQQRLARRALREASHLEDAGDLEGAHLLLVEALDADPLLSRARAATGRLVGRGRSYSPDQRARWEIARDRLSAGSASVHDAQAALAAGRAAGRVLEAARVAASLTPEIIDDPAVALSAAYLFFEIGLCERVLDLNEELENLEGEALCAAGWLQHRAARVCRRVPPEPPACEPPASTIAAPRVVFDLEDGLDGWERSAPELRPSRRPSRYTSGFVGQGVLRTAWVEGGVGGTLRAESPEFELDRDGLSLQVGGGSIDDDVRVALVIDGREVRTSAGQRDLHLRRVTWEVGEWVGRRARIRVIDEGHGRWGHLLVDHVRTHPFDWFSPPGRNLSQPSSR